VLVVTTTVWMLYWILCHTPNLWPAVTLDGILVVGVTSLEQWLVGTSSSGNNTNLCTAEGGYSLLTSRWKTETCGTLILIVGDNYRKTSRSTGKGPTVSGAALNIAHNGTLWYGIERQYISNGKCSLLSTVDKLSSVHTLRGNHELRITLETVGVEELDLGHWCSTSRVVKDLFDDSLDVPVFFGIVDGAEFDSSLARAGVCLEDGGFTLPLCLYS